MAKLKVVLVDKENVSREGLAKLLGSEPDIEVVFSCRTELEAVESAHKYQPDVIIIGMRSLESIGIEGAQRLTEDPLKTNIIVLTHSETDEDLVFAVAAGAKAYLSKFISFESLIKAVILVANGGVVISPPMAARLLKEFSHLKEAKGATDLITLLSKREKEVLSLVAQGFTNRDISDTLVISENTVKVHLRTIMEKLHARTRQHAVSLVGGKDLLPSVTQTGTM